MMYIKELGDYKDKSVTLKGWVYNLRSSGKIAFWQFRDGTGFIQCIIEKESIGDNGERFKRR